MNGSEQTCSVLKHRNHSEKGGLFSEMFSALQQYISAWLFCLNTLSCSEWMAHISAEPVIDEEHITLDRMPPCKNEVINVKQQIFDVSNYRKTCHGPSANAPSVRHVCIVIWSLSHIAPEWDRANPHTALYISLRFNESTDVRRLQIQNSTNCRFNL